MSLPGLNTSSRQTSYIPKPFSLRHTSRGEPSAKQHPIEVELHPLAEWLVSLYIVSPFIKATASALEQKRITLVGFVLRLLITQSSTPHFLPSLIFLLTALF